MTENDKASLERLRSHLESVSNEAITDYMNSEIIGSVIERQRVATSNEIYVADKWKYTVNKNLNIKVIVIFKHAIKTGSSFQWGYWDNIYESVENTLKNRTHRIRKYRALPINDACYSLHMRYTMYALGHHDA